MAMKDLYMSTPTRTQILAEVYNDVQQRFAEVNDPAHGWEHVRRVYNLALHLAEQEGADPFIAGIAALLHDIGRLAHDETKHHAQLSVEMAARLLRSYALGQDEVEAILHAISAHSYSQKVLPRTLEARVVRDADRLDGLGAIGIARWAITGTVRRTPQTRTYHPDDPFAEQHEPDDSIYMLDHFYTKLLKLVETMATRTGRAIAEQRTAFMRTYLEEFRSELVQARP